MRSHAARRVLHCALLLGFAASRTTAQVASSNVDWPYYGNDLGGMRYADIDQINSATVSLLQPAWIFYTGIVGDETSFESQPIVSGGALYVTSPHGHVFALDATTGAVKWAYTPDMPPLSKLAYCCGQVNRGVAVGGGKVYVAQLDANLVALDAGTGAVAWKIAVDPWQAAWTETMAPLYVNGKVIVGASGGEYMRRGHVSAYDAATGKMVWRFYTAPGPGELGNDTWAGESWRTGGATVWTTPVADTQLGLLYITTGNAAPDENGSRRAGMNLFSCSVVALNLDTGAYKWHFQEVHHDIWDYDSAQPAHLFTLTRNGRQIPALGHANKNGYYFLLDRRDGTPLFDVKETPVPTEPAWQNPWPTQPVPAIDELIPHVVNVVPKGLTAAPFWTPPQETPLLMQPGFEAGPEWCPSAYSPRTGYSYISAGGVEPWLYHSIPPLVNALGSTGADKIPGIENYGLLDAIDTNTGKMAWQVKTPEKIVSGVVVAGDLVFFGESQGKFNALDARSGKVLWSYEIPKTDQEKSRETSPAKTTMGGANGAPAVYMVNGREYVVMAFGGNNQVRSNAQVSNQGDALIAFALPTPGAVQPNISVANVKDVESGEISDANRIAGVATPPAGARTIELEVNDLDFNPSSFTVLAGERVAVHIVNHDFSDAGFAVELPSASYALKDPVAPGASTYFVFTAPRQPGTFEFYNEEARAVSIYGSGRVAPACSSSGAPCVSAVGVVNAAGFQNGAIAPGEIVSIFGDRLGPAEGQTQDFNPASGVLATSLAGTEVLIDGTPAPILYAQANQLNAIVPVGVAGKKTTTLQVTRESASSAVATLSVAQAAPSLFTVRGAGRGQAVIQNADGSLNSVENPAAKGTVVHMIATGLGQSTPPLADGQFAIGDTPLQFAAPASVLIGGVSADVLETRIPAGFFTGLASIEVRVPAKAPSGAAVPVQVLAGYIGSPTTATIAVQ